MIEPEVAMLELSGDEMFWSRKTGPEVGAMLGRTPKAGGSSTTLATVQGTVTFLGVAGEYLYWVEQVGSYDSCLRRKRV